MSSPVSSILAATCGPTILGRKCVQPMPGCRFNPTKVTPILASGLAILGYVVIQ